MIRYFRKQKQRTDVIPELIIVEDLGTKIVLSEERDYVIVLHPCPASYFSNEFYFYTENKHPENYMLPRRHLERLYEEISQAEFTASFL